MMRLVVLGSLVAALAGCAGLLGPSAEEPTTVPTVRDLHENCPPQYWTSHDVTLTFANASTPWPDVPRVVNETGLVRAGHVLDLDTRRIVILEWPAPREGLSGSIDRTEAPGLSVRLRWSSSSTSPFTTTTPSGPSPLQSYVTELRPAFEPTWGAASGGEIQTRQSMVVC